METARRYKKAFCEETFSEEKKFGEEKAKEGHSEAREPFCEEIRFESGEKAKAIHSEEKEIRSEIIKKRERERSEQEAGVGAQKRRRKRVCGRLVSANSETVHPAQSYGKRACGLAFKAAPREAVQQVWVLATDVTLTHAFQNVFASRTF